jgi:transposase
MNRDALSRLSNSDLIVLILAQADVIDRQTVQIQGLTKSVEELTAKLGKTPKTPDNSSVPPSKGEKPNRTQRRAKRRKGHPGVARALSDNPDRVVETLADSCPHCDHALSAADQPEFHAYDHIELPPIRPVVTRIHRHRGTCPCCRKGFSAPAPDGMAPGSPFGPELQALILHLHITQAISFERLVKLMDEVFGVVISEGAIANIMARAEAPMIVAAEKIAQTVRTSPVICSDETSARVRGKTWWQWVLLSSTAVYHLITDSRAARVVTGFLQGAAPEIWVADRYGAQNGHGAQRQVCLAHLLRDAQYAIDEGDTGFALRTDPPYSKACFNTRLTKAIPASPPVSSSCCCAPSPSDGGASPSKTGPSPNTTPTSTAASPDCWAKPPTPKPAASSPAASANAVTTSSSSSKGAMFPTPITVASELSDHP